MHCGNKSEAIDKTSLYLLSTANSRLDFALQYKNASN